MVADWCPSGHLQALESAGSVMVEDNKVNFNYEDLYFCFGARDEIEIFSEVFHQHEYGFEIPNDSVVLDIGANVGIATLYFARQQNVCKIYSFEPFGLTYQSLQRNVGLNPKYNSKIQTFHFGIGKEDSEETGIINPLFKGNSRLAAPGEIPLDFSNHEGQYQAEKITIKNAMTVLQTVIDENEGKDIYIKMDCEGAEEFIFENEGFVALLSRIKAIVMETHNPVVFQKICSILEGKGFDVESRMLSASNGFIKAISSS